MGSEGSINRAADSSKLIPRTIRVEPPQDTRATEMPPISVFGDMVRVLTTES